MEQQYTTIRFLQKGACRNVCLAQDHRTGKFVAIKQARVGSLEHERSILLLIQQKEIKGIPYLLETQYDWKGNICKSLILEYINGTSILQGKHMLPFSTMMQSITELFAIVSQLHKHHIEHGDLCNKNILHGNDGHVYLIDFGWARLVHNTTPEHIRDEIFQDEIAGMIHIAENWTRQIAQETNRREKEALVMWLEKARENINSGTWKEQTFLTTWQQIRQRPPQSM